MTELVTRYQKVRARIAAAAAKSSRAADDIALLAVSKKKSVEDIIQVAECGQRDFGENYLQEALEKITKLNTLDLCWHFIGPIQSNKTRAIAEHFDWAHSVDRLKIAKRLSEQRPNELPPLNICLQVNIDEEDSKSGFHPDEVGNAAEQIATLPNLNVRGLMAIPNPALNTCQAFSKMKALSDNIKNKNIAPHWNTLSMGMSSDLEAAIEHGASMVRIGSDIFGPRAT
ncbi:MAG: YggS family pyridoxal phosphate-dependent enzyme [Agarilytica sp.]